MLFLIISDLTIDDIKNNLTYPVLDNLYIQLQKNIILFIFI